MSGNVLFMYQVNLLWNVAPVVFSNAAHVRFGRSQFWVSIAYIIEELQGNYQCSPSAFPSFWRRSAPWGRTPSTSARSSSLSRSSPPPPPAPHSLWTGGLQRRRKRRRISLQPPHPIGQLPHQLEQLLPQHLLPLPPLSAVPAPSPLPKMLCSEWCLDVDWK